MSNKRAIDEIKEYYKKKLCSPNKKDREDAKKVVRRNRKK